MTGILAVAKLNKLSRVFHNGNIDNFRTLLHHNKTNKSLMRTLKSSSVYGSAFVGSKSTSPSVQARQAEKRYIFARSEGKQLLIKLNQLKAQLAQLEDREVPTDQILLMQFNEKRAKLTKQITATGAEYSNAILMEETFYKQLTEALNEAQLLETNQEGRNKSRMMLAALIGLVGGLGGSLIINSQHFNNGVNEYKANLKAANIEELVKGVEKAVYHTNLDELTVALKNMNAALTQDSSKKNAQLPHMIKQFDALKKVVTKIEKTIASVDGSNKVISDMLRCQLRELQRVLKEPKPSSLEIQQQISNVTGDIIEHFNEALIPKEEEPEPEAPKQDEGSDCTPAVEEAVYVASGKTSAISKLMIAGIASCFLSYVLQ